jgi:hypothetical protein
MGNGAGIAPIVSGERGEKMSDPKGFRAEDDGGWSVWREERRVGVEKEAEEIRESMEADLGPLVQRCASPRMAFPGYAKQVHHEIGPVYADASGAWYCRFCGRMALIQDWQRILAGKTAS